MRPHPTHTPVEGEVGWSGHLAAACEAVGDFRADCYICKGDEGAKREGCVGCGGACRGGMVTEEAQGYYKVSKKGGTEEKSGSFEG